MLGLLSRPVEFKEVFTNKTIICHINPYLTISQFIETIRPILASQFSINENDIEIVESGQYALGIPEMAPKLEPSLIQLCNRWGEKLHQLSFYVRKQNYSYPQMQIQLFDGTCPICLDTTTLSRRYQCSHGVCLPCYRRCNNSLPNNNCSICRSN